MKVLVAVASGHGSTREIAGAIADVLRAARPGRPPLPWQVPDLMQATHVRDHGPSSAGLAEVENMIPREFLGAVIGSNVVSLGLVLLAIRWPRLARVLFALIFLGAGVFNLTMAVRDPEVYLVYARWAVDFYRRFLWLGVAGGIVFLLAIAPLGVGSAFPSTLLMAVALYLMWRRLGGRRLPSPARVT
ncbi:MAG: hypothetical protein H5U04_05385 [Firmicutes bacterium]|nr:hypothetical protein [Bacillota bacterium]